MYRLVSLFAASMLFVSATHAEMQLYETGPSEESSYIRFVNATDKDISVTSSRGAKVELTARAEGRVSRFYTVKAGSKLSATVQSAGRKVAVEVAGKPWEYITVVALPDSTMQVKTVKETPTDFNAMRASLALFNLDAKCGGAVMLGGAQRATILSEVKPDTVQRRLVNPIKLAATVGCAGQAMESAVDLGQLQAGERYSVFLVPDNKARQVFFVRDVN